MKRRLWALARTRMFRKGVLGGDRRWLALWAGVTVTRMVHRRINRPAPAERVTLKPGESLLVQDTGQTWARFEAGDPA
jgi:hypothetical protein